MQKRWPWLTAGIGCWVLLATVWPVDAIHPDSTHDLLMARDCLELGRCDTAGPVTSVAGVHQGALWPNLLTLAAAAGLRPVAVGWCLALLHAASLTAVAWRAGSWLVWALLVGLSVAGVPVVLWSPTILTPFALLGAGLALDAALAGGRLRGGLQRWLLAGVLLGCAVDLHVAAWPLVLGCVIVAGGRQSGVGAALLALVALLTTTALSPRAWLVHAQTLTTWPLWWASLVGALLLAAVVVRLLLPRCRQVPAWWCLTALGGVIAVAGALGHQWALRYLLPWAVPLALTVRDAFSHLSRRWPRLVLTATLMTVLLWTVRVSHDPEPLPTYTEAADLASRSPSPWPEVLWRAQAAHRGEVHAEALAVFLPVSPAELAARPQPFAARAWPGEHPEVPRRPESSIPVLQPGAQPALAAVATELRATVGEPDIRVARDHVVLHWQDEARQPDIRLTHSTQVPYFASSAAPDDPRAGPLRIALQHAFAHDPWVLPRHHPVPPLPLTRPASWALALAVAALCAWVVGLGTFVREPAKLGDWPDPSAQAAP